MVRLAVVPLALGVAQASVDLAGYSFAKETPGFLMKEVAVAAAPAPTAAPLENILEKRGTNTCGFIEGDALSGVTCRADLGAECLYDETASAIGCCATEDCNIWTACLDYTESDKTSTADMDRTRWCSDSTSAFCAIYDYQDEEWDGYTMHLCTTKRTTYDFYFTPEGADEDDVTSFDEEDDLTTTSSTRSSRTAGGGSREPTTTSDSQDDEEEEEDDGGGGAPIGAIVGGTIGGVAVLAIVGLAIFFILRRRKKTDAAGPPQQPMAGMPPYPNQPQYPNQPGGPNQQMYSAVPSMYMPPPGGPQQGGYLQPGTPGESGAPMGYYNPQQDNRNSMKPPASPLSPGSQFAPSEPTVYNPSMAGMPAAAPPTSVSPPHQGPTPPGQGHTPPPPGYGPAPGGYPQQGGYGNAVELPTGRPDGELRELA